MQTSSPRIRTPFRSAAVALTCWLLPLGALCAQGTEGTPPASTPRELVTRALSALGGPAAVGAATTLRWVAEGRTVIGEQARRPADSAVTVPTRTSYAVELGRRARLTTDVTYPGGIRFLTGVYIDSGGVASVDLLRWRSGWDLARSGPAQGVRAMRELPRLLPHLIVSAALANDSSLHLLPGVERDGFHRDVITAVLTPGARPVRLELDAESHLLLLLASGSARDESSIEFSGYRAEPGPRGPVRVPSRMIQRAGGAMVSDTRVAALTIGGTLAESLFTIPAGYGAPPATPPEPRATALAPGTYRLDGLPGDYHALVVEQGDSLVLVEAPLAGEWATRAIRLLAATLPGKRVRTVVVTHHHGDHVGGIDAFVAEGATIVTGVGVGVALHRQLPDSLGRRLRLIEVADHLRLGSGAQALDVYAVPNEHADGTLIAHQRANGILAQGDLFYLAERGPVPAAFPVTVALRRAVRQRGLRVTTVVGVHGRTGTLVEMDSAIALAAARPPAPSPRAPREWPASVSQAKIDSVFAAARDARARTRAGFRWSMRRSPHFVILSEPNTLSSADLDSITTAAERARAGDLALLGARGPAAPTNLYLVASRARMSDLIGLPVGGFGGGGDAAQFVASPGELPPLRHELMHLLARTAWGQPWRRWVDEGIATSAPGSCDGYDLHELVNDLQRRREAVPIATMEEDYGTVSDLVTYVEGGSFAQFVAERFGKDALHDLWSRGLAGLTGRTGMDAAALESAWQARIAEPRYQRRRVDWNAIRQHGCE